MDYAFPVLLLVLFLSTDLHIAAKLILGLMVIASILVSVNTYRASMDSHNLYLNNLFIHKTIPFNQIRQIEPAPFYYGATGGRVSEKGYRIVYEKNSVTLHVVVLVSKGKESQQLWNQLIGEIGVHPVHSG